MKRKFFNFALITSVTLGILGSVLFSPLFTAETVELQGLINIQPDQIKSIAGLTDSTNIFIFNDGLAKSKLLENRYIDNVDIKKDFFSKIITIKIEERILSGYIEHSSGSYLYIDDKGRVLEVKSHITQSLPLVTGLNFSEFTLGEPLPVKNSASFESLVTLVTLFNKYNLQGDVIKVDISDETNITFLINKVEVQFGSIRDADEKIRTLIGIREKKEKVDFDKHAGFLDIRDITLTPRFKYLT